MADAQRQCAGRADAVLRLEISARGNLPAAAPAAEPRTPSEWPSHWDRRRRIIAVMAFMPENVKNLICDVSIEGIKVTMNQLMLGSMDLDEPFLPLILELFKVAGPPRFTLEDQCHWSAKVKPCPATLNSYVCENGKICWDYFLQMDADGCRWHLCSPCADKTPDRQHGFHPLDFG